MEQSERLPPLAIAWETWTMTLCFQVREQGKRANRSIKQISRRVWLITPHHDFHSKGEQWWRYTGLVWCIGVAVFTRCHYFWPVRDLEFEITVTLLSHSGPVILLNCDRWIQGWMPSSLATQELVNSTRKGTFQWGKREFFRWCIFQ